MTVYFQGAEIQDFVLTGNAIHSTAAGDFNSSNSRAAAVPSSTTGTSSGSTETNDILDGNFSAGATDFWTHFYCKFGTTVLGTTNRFLMWLSGGTRLLGLRLASSTGPTTVEIGKFASGAWSTLGTATAGVISTNTLYKFDVHIVIGNPGTVAVYLDGVPIFNDNTLNLSWAGVSSFDAVRLARPIITSGAATRFSEIIVADWNTVGSKLVTAAPDANGNYTAWAGAGYTALNEVTPAATYMTSGTANQRISVSLGNFPALAANERVESVKVVANALRDASGPQKLNLFYRVNGTDNDDSDQSLTLSAANYSHSWAASPDTASYWTPTELNASEPGVRSRT
ncbi:hypothetical protein EOA37_09740 [Mesorhizobium sp. M2A.F.Ca.ET.015.02.1.1]|uniref:hypothetical protein n=1 Tax=Mesorhizobium sp. M2A.F.Ca.ET.015.02.1.1 TaxID=2496758 RepID=UPI000FCABA7D|nr:hypothetical protein [Mesorhizobium sp. M2A.F.Ca.ET.015.02.1.1]RUW41533.1 hypothetical protein EOA37_09740 [Mesorhizobium sp. M2A.F.Ca.ET.015.02.1.1]